MPDSGQFYHRHVRPPKIVFDQGVDDKADFEKAVSVFQAMRRKVEAGPSRYKDVTALWQGDVRIGWMVRPESSHHHRVVFFDAPEMWSVAEEVGAKETLESYVPSDEEVVELY